jgi:hypothetical protein
MRMTFSLVFMMTVAFCGCAGDVPIENSQAVDEMVSTASFSAGKVILSDSDAENTAAIEETESTDQTITAPEVVCSHPENQTTATNPTTTRKTTSTTLAVTTTKTTTTTQSTTTATTSTTAVTTQAPTTTAAQPSGKVNAWGSAAEMEADCRAYAVSVGMTWDSSLTKSNASWDNPTSSYGFSSASAFKSRVMSNISEYQSFGYTSIMVIFEPYNNGFKAYFLR